MDELALRLSKKQRKRMREVNCRKQKSSYRAHGVIQGKRPNEWKCSPARIREIQWALAGGMTIERARAVFGVGWNYIHDIREGRTTEYDRLPVELEVGQRYRKVRCPICGSKLKRVPCLACQLREAEAAWKRGVAKTLTAALRELWECVLLDRSKVWSTEP